jgi:hypothetical protein
MNRLTDNDHNFGPLTIARNKWRMVYVILSSGGDDKDEQGYRNHLKIQAFNWCVRVKLPNFIQPFTYHQSYGSIKSNTYPVTLAREYGFQFHEGDSFSLLYGPQSGFNNLPDDVKEKRKHWFMAWKQWRMVRHSLYDQNGNHFWSEPDMNKLTREERAAIREQYDVARDECPRVTFWLEDYDGDLVKTTTYIEEREWHRGEKWWSWLSWFYKPMVRRSLDIHFDRETGKEKGSWKGGTIGTSITMEAGESHESALRRYCEQEHRSKSGPFRMKFLGSQEPTRNQ